MLATFSTARTISPVEGAPALSMLEGVFKTQVLSSVWMRGQRVVVELQRVLPSTSISCIQYPRARRLRPFSKDIANGHSQCGWMLDSHLFSLVFRLWAWAVCSAFVALGIDQRV